MLRATYFLAVITNNIPPIDTVVTLVMVTFAVVNFLWKDKKKQNKNLVS